MARVHASLELNGNADCTEFCPIPGWQPLLAAATYTLTEGEPPKRDGILYLYQVSPQEPHGALGLTELQRVHTTGIFDIKWSQAPINGRPVIAQAGADGSLSLHTLQGARPAGAAGARASPPHAAGSPRGDGPALHPLCRVDLGSDRMCLSVDWAETPAPPSAVGHEEPSGGWGPGGGGHAPATGEGEPSPAWELDRQGDVLTGSSGQKGEGGDGGDAVSDPLANPDEDRGLWLGDAAAHGGAPPRRLAVSHSDGALSVVTLAESELQLDASWPAHDYEAWVAAFDVDRPQRLLYSGGDDCCFKGWDLREGGSRPVFSNRKAHRMGVCSIRGSHLRPHTLATGSYDESVRVWDTRNMGMPLCAAQAGTGGGVWRVKWHPRDPTRILAAVMHAGFCVLELGADGTLQVKEHYNGHSSLGYGADWFRGGVGLPLEGKENAAVGASVSGDAGFSGDDGSVSCHAYEHDIVATCSFYDRSLQLWSPSD